MDTDQQQEPAAQAKQKKKRRPGAGRKSDPNQPAKAIPVGIGEWYEYLADEGKLITRQRTQQVRSNITGQMVTVEVPGGVDAVTLQDGEVPWPSVRFNGRNYHAARIVWFLVNGKDANRLVGPKDGNPMNIQPGNWQLRRGAAGRPPGSVAKVRTKELYGMVVDLQARLEALERCQRMADAAALTAARKEGGQP